MLAEIHGKISSTGSNVDDVREDLLTSDIFGPARYVSADVFLNRPAEPTSNITGGVLSIRFLEGDRRLPVLRLRRAA